MSATQTLSIRLTADGKALSAEFKNVAGDVQKFTNSTDAAGAALRNNFSGATREGIQSISQSLGAARQQLLGFFGIQVGAGLIKQLAGTADAATNLTSKLRNVTDGEEALGRVRQATFAIAQRTRQEYASTVELYARLTRATATLGLSEEQRLRITETTNKAMVVSGASTREASAAIIQLSQALASGTLRGDEFNSIAEQAPIIMDLVAQSLGKTRGELRAYAADGKLTAEVVTKALLDGGAQVDAQFVNMSLSIGGASEQLSNALVKWVGDSDRGLGASKALAAGISVVADNVEGIATVIGGVMAVALARYVGGLAAAGVQQAKSVLTANSLAKAELQEARAAEAVAIAQNNKMAAMARAGIAGANLAKSEGVLAAAQTRTAAATAASVSGFGLLRGAGASLFAFLGGWATVLTVVVGGLFALASQSSDTADELKRLDSQTTALQSSSLSLADVLPLIESGNRRVTQSILERKTAQLAAIDASIREESAGQKAWSALQTLTIGYSESRAAATLLRGEVDQLAASTSALGVAALRADFSKKITGAFGLVRNVIEQTVNWQDTLTRSLKAGSAELDDQAASLEKHAGELGKTKTEIIGMAKANELAAAAARYSAKEGSDAYKLIVEQIDKKYSRVLAAAKADDTATAAQKAKTESEQAGAASSRELARDQDLLLRVIEDNNTAIAKGAELAGELANGLGGPLSQATRSYNTDIDTLAVALDALESQMALGVITAEKYAAAKRDLTDAASNAGEAFDRETAAIAKQGDVLGNYLAQVQADQSLVGLSDRQRAITLALRDATAEWYANEAAGRANKNTLDEVTAGVGSAAAGLYDYTTAAEASQTAANNWARQWQQGVASVSDAIGDLVASGLSDWKKFGNSLVSLARQYISQIVSEFAKAKILQFFGVGNGTVGGGSGIGFAQIFGAFAGGGNAGSGGGGGGGFNLGTLGQAYSAFSGQGTGGLFNSGSWTSAGQNLWSGFSSTFGGAAASGILGTAGTTGLGSFVGAGSLGWTGASGLGAAGFGGTFGGGVGAYGAGASASGVGSAASSAVAVPIVGWIIAGVLANMALVAKGWNSSNTQNDYLIDGLFAGSQGTIGNLLEKFGVSSKWAHLGDGVASRLFGRESAKATGFDSEYNFGADGIGGNEYVRWKQKGGYFRSDKNGVDKGELAEQTRAGLQAFYDQIVAMNAQIAAQVLGSGAAVVEASFRTERDKKGNITKEIGTIMGRDYLATWEEFQQIVLTENIIAAAASGSAMVEVATPAQQIRVRDPETGRWTIEYQEAGTTLVNELQLLADRFRGNAALLAEGASLLLAVQTDLSNGNELLGESGAGALTHIVDFVTELQHSGESLPAAYSRIAQSAALLDQALGLSGINLDATREDVVRFAAGIVDLAGGVDQAGALYDNLYNRLYTPEERTGYALQQATTSATTQFAAAGLKLDDFTGEDGFAKFRELWEQQLPNMSAEQTVEYLRLAQSLGQLSDLTAQYNALVGQTAAPVAQSAEQLQAVLDILAGNEWDLAAASMTTAERAIAEVNRSFDEQKKSALETAATVKQLAVLEEQRNAALAQQQAILAAQRSDILAGNERDLGQAGMTSAERALADINLRYDEQRAKLEDLGATTKELITQEDQRTRALEQQLAALAAQRSEILDGNDRDLAQEGMTSAERAIATINQRYDEQRAKLEDLGATTGELTRLDEQRTLALEQQQAALAAQRADILAGNDRDLGQTGMTSAERAIADINDRYAQQRRTLEDLGATTDDLTRLDEQRTLALQQQAEAMAAQRAQILSGNANDLARAGMTDFERQLADINDRFNAQRATMEDLGATTAELTQLEDQRNQTLRDAAAAESARLAAAGVEYRNFIENLWRDTSNLSDFQRESFRIEDWQEEQIAAANAHAQAAGAAGASEQALALIERRAAQMRAAAIAQLRSETQSLFDQLYGGANQVGDNFNDGVSTAAQAADDFWQRQREAIQSLNDYLDSMLLGDLSALTPEEQLASAWQQLQDAVAAGDANRATQLSDVYLRLLRASTASGDDYNNGANGQAGFWDVRALLEGLRNSIAGQTPPEQTGNVGSGSGQTAEQAAALIAADRLALAVQFAQHLHDLAGALNTPILQLAEDMGLSLNALASDLGINLDQITGASVQALAGMASMLGINLTELTGALGLELTSLGGGIRELAAGLGIDLTALTTQSTEALAALANQLGLDLTDVAAAVGISLGSLSDSQSLLNQALGDQINALPADQRDLLRPLFDAIANATNEADANAAIDALNAAVNLLAPDIRNLLAPYLADVFPADALSDLDYLSELAVTSTDQLTAVREVRSEVATVRQSIDIFSDRLASKADEQITIQNSLLVELQRIANNTASQNNASGLPSYAVGTGRANVQGDQVAQIHHGEKVIDAQTTAFLDRYGIRVSGGGGDNADVVAALYAGFRNMRADFERLKRAVENGSGNVAREVAESSERNVGVLDRAMQELTYVAGSGGGRSSR